MSDEAELRVILEDEASGPAHKMGGAIGDLVDWFDKLDDSGMSVGQMFSFAFGGLIEDAIEKVIDFGKEIVVSTVEMASFGQEAEDSFATITGSAAMGEEAFNRARQVSLDLGLEIQKTTSRMQQFMRLGFNAEQAEGFVKMAADLGNLGLAAQDVDGVMNALSRIQAKGALDSRAMLELAKAGVTTDAVYSRLGGSLGKTQAEIKKLADAGKISAGDAMTAIQQELLGKLGETAFGQRAAEDAATQLAGLKGKLMAQLTDLQLAIGKEIAPGLTEGLKVVTEQMTTFLHSADGKKTLKSLADGLVEVIRHLPEIIAVAGAVVDVLKIVGQWIKTVGQLTIGIGEAIGAAVFAVADAMANFEARLNAGVGIIRNVANTLYDIGRNLVLGFVRGITGSISFVHDAVKGIGGAAVNALKSALGIASPSRVMMELGGFTAEGFGQGIEQGADRHVVTAADSMAGAAVASAAPGSGGRGGGSSVVNLSVEVTASPGMTHRQAESIGESIAFAIERKLGGSLEGFALAAGA